MSVSKWRWTPACDSGICINDCDLCDKAEFESDDYDFESIDIADTPLEWRSVTEEEYKAFNELWNRLIEKRLDPEWLAQHEEMGFEVPAPMILEELDKWEAEHHAID